MAKKFPIRDVLTTRNTPKDDKGRWAPIRYFKTLNRNDNKHVSPYEENVKTLKRKTEQAQLLKENIVPKLPQENRGLHMERAILLIMENVVDVQLP